MNVAIFETEHYEGSYPVIRLFDTGRNNITIFTNEVCHRQFQFLFGTDMNRYTWVVQTSNQTKYDFIYFLGKEVKKRNIDLLWLNTVSNNHIVYATMLASLGNLRTILTIHDINGYFTFVPAFNLKRFVRYIGKRRLIRRVNEFNVVGNAMVNHLKKKLPPEKKVYNIPGCVFEPISYVKNELKDAQAINIVVPGSLDVRRRNYAQVFELLDQLSSKNIKVNVTLLGGFNSEYGQWIKDEINLYTDDADDLTVFWNEIVDQPLFDKTMNEAHFVFLPSVQNTILFDGVTETYGESICSGNIFDVIKHARPAIIPSFLNIPPELESSSLRYFAVEEICELLQATNYEDIAQKAFSNSMHFTAEALRERNPGLFEQE
ncbi:MAG TPA: hypothetical protein VJT83_01585 [Chitinophagaceae bacterium]|nr:hypothetical protein [Chitinophagaceae bacterium]